MSLRGRPLLIRSASSATITLFILSAVLCYLIFKGGWSSTRGFNAIVFVSGLWVLGWPFAIAMSAATKVGTSWGRKLVSNVPADTPAEPPPSSRLAIVGAAFFALSMLALAGVVVRAMAQVARDYQAQSVGGEVAPRDPREPPALPMSFSAETGRDALFAELGLSEMWSTGHPQYHEGVRVLITSAPVEGLSPNYRAAFYHRRGDAFVRIGNGFSFGGCHPPELGRHPNLDLPAILCVAEVIPERLYFFVQDGLDQTFQENGETWKPVEDLR